MENDSPGPSPPNIWNFPYVSSFFFESFPNEGNEYYDEDSSEEVPDGPFQMITETNFNDEDYYDL